MRKRLDALRQQLLSERGITETELRRIAEDRESELEERSQGEAAADVLARLDAHDSGRVREVFDALDRLADGSYGLCLECGKRILLPRLRAIPAARLCGACALADERARYEPNQTAASADAEIATAATPPELRALSDTELTQFVREQLREEMGESFAALRVVCRHGRVTLAGEITSDELRQVALRIVEEEIGLETVDHVRVTELAGERPYLETGDVPVRFGEDQSLDDPFDVDEEGLEYSPPARPTPEIE